MSSVFLPIGLALAGTFTVVLGIVHIGIPRIVRFRLAIGADGGGAAPLGRLVAGPLGYDLRRSDLVGITWVMSNAASYVLITIGLADLAWAAGWRGVAVDLGALWVAGWWAIRAAGQLALGHRAGDVLAVAWFGALAAGHLAVALAAGALG